MAAGIRAVPATGFCVVEGVAGHGTSLAPLSESAQQAPRSLMDLEEGSARSDSPVWDCEAVFINACAAGDGEIATLQPKIADGI